MKKIHIFDIDGTILPSIFSNMQVNDISIDQFTKDVLKRSRDVDLYPEFITFYSHNCINNSKNIFLTGRQERPFGNLTHLQLLPLKTISSFYIIFYPEDNIYSLDRYFSWKVQEIQKLFLKYNAHDHNEHIRFIIYDDMTTHFNDIKELSDNLGLDITFRSITDSNDWNIMN